MEPRIYIAFRFHGNFYHSYRGDTPDELGFGKDIRIIRRIIEILDEYNRRGIGVRGTWDFENYFSLEKIMPEHCPDLIASLQRRVLQYGDEIQFMSYNNGLVSAHTAREFEQTMLRARTNPAGSGLLDLFGENYFPMVRPQEMMFTPIHLKLYRACGIDAISLYYSALPFNGFSSFIPALSLEERYNPLTLAYPGIEETMTLLPCFNTGDLADHLTLRRWVSGMRRQQMAMQAPCDLLLLLDQDADDPTWIGFEVPAWLKNRFSTVRGLPGLIDDVQGLDYIRFTTPGRYLQDHPPIKTISIGQDTADGSFDGLSSWAEKWSNQRLFTGLERARILELQTRRLFGSADPVPEAVQTLLDESFESRLRLLSTTHFGMAAPVMNLRREQVGRDLVQQAVDTAAAAFEKTVSRSASGNFSLLDYVRGVSTDAIRYQAHPSQALVRLPLRERAPEHFALRRADGEPIQSATLPTGAGRELVFVDRFEPAEQKHYALERGAASPKPVNPVSVSANHIQNQFLSITLDEAGQVTGLQINGVEFAGEHFIESAVAYGGRLYRVEQWTETASLAAGVVGLKQMKGMLTLKGSYPVQFEREILVAAGLPYVYLTTRVAYPRTPDQGYNPGKALRLQQAWDNAWQAVLPCEIRPSLRGTAENPLRVWKHNYCDHISTYDLDYSRFSDNRELDNANNQITHAWVAVSDGRQGLLLAQNADAASNFAFCPLRTRRQGDVSILRMNPFGTYWGRQYHYRTADTRLGNLLATTFSAADHIRPYAPSFNGRTQKFSLLIAPYSGDAPPETVRFDAEAYAYPYAVLNDAEFIDTPAHRTWDGAGLGEIP